MSRRRFSSIPLIFVHSMGTKKMQRRMEAMEMPVAA
jgi:hypothetical protein